MSSPLRRFRRSLRRHGSAPERTCFRVSLTLAGTFQTEQASVAALLSPRDPHAVRLRGFTASPAGLRAVVEGPLDGVRGMAADLERRVRAAATHPMAAPRLVIEPCEPSAALRVLRDDWFATRESCGLPQGSGMVPLDPGVPGSQWHVSLPVGLSPSGATGSGMWPRARRPAPCGCPAPEDVSTGRCSAG